MNPDARATCIWYAPLFNEPVKKITFYKPDWTKKDKVVVALKRYKNTLIPGTEFIKKPGQPISTLTLQQ
jgi:hypothetical protein